MLKHCKPEGLQLLLCVSVLRAFWGGRSCGRGPETYGSRFRWREGDEFSQGCILERRR